LAAKPLTLTDKSTRSETFPALINPLVIPSIDDRRSCGLVRYNEYNVLISREERAMYDLIVIGGGAAGLAATAFALGKRLAVLMIAETPGGKTGPNLTLPEDAEAAVGYLVGHMMVYLTPTEARTSGEPQLVGAEAIQRFERTVERHAGTLLEDTVTALTSEGGVFSVQTLNHGTHRSTAVIIATGVTPQRLDVPEAQRLLEYGLSYSTLTYARLLDGRRAAVVGATARALRGAAELSAHASEVFLILPETPTLNLRLLDLLRQRPNVTVMEGYRVVALSGAKHVEQIVVERHGQQQTIAVDAVFAALGLRPNSRLVNGLAKTDADGFIWVNDYRGTTLPGLFAAGDVTTAFGEHALIAAGDGMRAALSAYDYILSRPRQQEQAAVD
jgi:thioredoxin reductase